MDEETIALAAMEQLPKEAAGEPSISSAEI